MRLFAGVGLDVVMVVIFALIGRSSHAEQVTPAGLFLTAWPYIVAAVLGSLIARAWRDPYGWRTGIVVWVSTVVLGMLLRRLAGGTTAFSFWIVAFVSLGILLLGWRLAARVIGRVTARKRSGRQTPTRPRSVAR